MGKIFDYDGVPVLHTTSGDLKGYFYDGVYTVSYTHLDVYKRQAQQDCVLQSSLQRFHRRSA